MLFPTKSAALAGAACLFMACSADMPTMPATSGPSSTAIASIVSPYPLGFVVIDPQGDNVGLGQVDVRSMIFRFDPTTGNYEITFNADPGAPFVGPFRINVNLVRPLPASFCFFQDAVNDFDLAAPVQSMTLTGTSAQLTTWAAGQAVSLNNLDGSPNPPSGFFRTSVLYLPQPLHAFLTDEDNIAFADRSLPAIIQSLDGTGLLNATITSLQAGGVLNGGQGNGLLNKLENITKKIAQGKTSQAKTELQAFINQVNGLTPNTIDAQSAALLVDQAQALLATL